MNLNEYKEIFNILT